MVSAQNLPSQNYRYCKLTLNEPKFYISAIYQQSKVNQAVQDTINVSPLIVLSDQVALILKSE
jgi:hypothetical protein